MSYFISFLSIIFSLNLCFHTPHVLNNSSSLHTHTHTLLILFDVKRFLINVIVKNDEQKKISCALIYLLIFQLRGAVWLYFFLIFFSHKITVILLCMAFSEHTQTPHTYACMCVSVFFFFSCCFKCDYEVRHNWVTRSLDFHPMLALNTLKNVCTSWL